MLGGACFFCPVGLVFFVECFFLSCGIFWLLGSFVAFFSTWCYFFKLGWYFSNLVVYFFTFVVFFEFCVIFRILWYVFWLAFGIFFDSCGIFRVVWCFFWVLGYFLTFVIYFLLYFLKINKLVFFGILEINKFSLLSLEISVLLRFSSLAISDFFDFLEIGVFLNLLWNWCFFRILGINGYFFYCFFQLKAAS